MCRCPYRSGALPPPAWLSESLLDERYPRLVKDYYKNRPPTRPHVSQMEPGAEAYLRMVLMHSDGHCG